MRLLHAEKSSSDSVIDVSHGEWRGNGGNGGNCGGMEGIVGEWRGVVEELRGLWGNAGNFGCPMGELWAKNDTFMLFIA